MKRKELLYIILLTIMVLLLSACQREEAHPVQEQAPGTIAGGVYFSRNADFTLQAEEKVWTPGTLSDDDTQLLYLTKGGSVEVAFTRTEGVSAREVEAFDEAFAAEFVEDMKEAYPDVRLKDYKRVNDFLVRLDMDMTGYSGDGSYPMRQIFYMATDGEDGYLIFAVLPDTEAPSELSQIYDLVESMEFVNNESKQ